MDYFSHVLILAETGSQGGVRITYLPDTLRLYSLVDSSGSVVFVIVECIVALFFVYFWYKEIRAGCERGWSYFFKVRRAAWGRALACR